MDKHLDNEAYPTGRERACDREVHGHRGVGVVNSAGRAVKWRFVSPP